MTSSPSAYSGSPFELRAIWLAAHRHRRTVGLCKAWDIPLVLLFPARRNKLFWLIRVPAAVYAVVRQRPQVVFVANPSIVLTTLMLLLKLIMGFSVVVDAHNEGVRPFDRPNFLVRRLTRSLLKSATVTLVSNSGLSRDVQEAGGRPVVLPDRLPDYPDDPAEIGGATVGRAVDVVVVATFRRDEPISELLEAAKTMTKNSFAFTGHKSSFEGLGLPLPANVKLTGYLSDKDYWSQLRGAAVICDLTLKADCLVCGAYEGLALGKPLVLTDDPANHYIFGSSAVYVKRLDAAGISAALSDALERQVELQSESRESRTRYATHWELLSREVQALIGDSCRSHQQAHGS